MTGLIGWWPLHEDSGSKAYDLSGNDNHGTLNGGVTQGVAGKGGLTSYSFDGSDDHIDTGFIPSNSSLSYAVWVKLDTVNSGNNIADAVSMLDSGPNSGTKIAHSDNDGFFLNAYDENNGNGATSTSRYSAEAGKWYHLAATYDSATDEWNFYIDGVSKESFTQSLGPMQSAWIGDGRGYPNQIPAKISDVRMYNRPLSQQEVKTLYEWGNGDYARPPDGDDSSAVSRWAFEGDVTDSWNSNNGVDNTSIGYSNGIRGQAKDFDGSDDYIELPDINIGTQHTISIWAKQDTTQSAGRIILGQNGGDGYFPWTDNNGSNFWYKAQNEPVSFDSKSPSYFLGDYIHLTAVREGTAVTLYINGVRQDTKNLTSNVDFIFNEIGGDTDSSTNYFWDGIIDDVRIYDKALSPQEVFELYRWGTRGRDMRKFTVNSRGL